MDNSQKNECRQLARDTRKTAKQIAAQVGCSEATAAKYIRAVRSQYRWTCDLCGKKLSTSQGTRNHKDAHFRKEGYSVTAGWGWFVDNMKDKSTPSSTAPAPEAKS